MIEPFFFGPRGALAFYHPSSDPAATRTLIICPPLFDEYRRTYRALSDLANACAANGVHVVRIDYSGTGESQGMLADITGKEWIDDISTVIEESIDLTGAQNIILAGVRFGATLAAQVNHPAVQQYIFWDPVDDGHSYMLWLAKLEKLSHACHTKLSKLVNSKAEDIKYSCFPLNESLVKTLASINTDSVLAKHGEHVRVISTDNNICKRAVYKHCEYAGYDYDWPAYHDGMLTPKPVLERIAKTVLMP